MTVKTRSRSISSLKPGETVRLKFHGSKQFGNDPYELDAEFIAFNADKTRATFNLEPDAESKDEFEAYKYVNRWAYGTSAEKLSIVS